MVFVETNRFKPDEAQHHAARTVHLPVATSDSGKLIGAALASLASIWRGGYRYKKAELEAASDGLAEELRGFPPLAQRSAKKLINDIEDAGLSLAIELEGQCYGRLRSSDDFREGVEAFHQKRRPEFRGK